MFNVSKRELNQATASVLKKITKDSPALVTERNTPRWIITLVQPQESPLELLERQGLYTPPKEHPSPWDEKSSESKYSDEQIDQLIADNKGDY